MNLTPKLSILTYDPERLLADAGGRIELTFPAYDGSNFARWHTSRASAEREAATHLSYLSLTRRAIEAAAGALIYLPIEPGSLAPARTSYKFTPA